MAFLAGLFGGGSASSSSSSGAASANRAASSPVVPSYSFAKLQSLYDRLSQFRESDLERAGGGDAVVETVRQITEALLWGEQNDANFFDFFCEKSILADFIRVLGLARAPKQVKVQLLQTLSMLVQNIKRQTSLYYLLSNNHMNRLIGMPLDLTDEEILAYYITLLKSLAMRLDMETIKFFFIHHHAVEFPLYIEATNLFAHRDQMVRATVRTITLQVYRLEDAAMRKFVLRNAAESYFQRLALHLRDLWLRLDVAVGCATWNDLAAAQHESELQQDMLIYLSDVFDLEVAEFNEVLADRLLSCAVLPVLLAGVATSPGQASANDQEARVISPRVALYLARQVIDTFHSRVLLEPLCSALLQPTVPAALAYALPGLGGDIGPGRSPSSYSQGDFVLNPLRDRFISFLTSKEDATFLLAAGLVHSCIRNRRALPLSFLQSASIMPDAGDVQPDVVMLLLQGLRRNVSWGMDTFQCLISIIMDLCLDPGVYHHRQTRGLIYKALQDAVRSTAQELKDFVQTALCTDDSMAQDDSILDIFVEEWDLLKAPPISVGELCSNPRRLLVGVASAPRRSGSRRVDTGISLDVKKAVRSFLLLQRLLADIARFGPLVPRDRADGDLPQYAPSYYGQEECPLQVDQEAAEVIREGQFVEIGRMDRIVCGVAAPNGKHTRYLLLHDYWLMLVQPDLSTPGWATVRTSWPLRQVQSLIDRSDPRTLQIGMRGCHGQATPGETKSTTVAPPLAGHVDTGDERPGSYSTLSLNFEDVRRCHFADVHLRKRRREVRLQLLSKAAALFDQACAEIPYPEPLSAPPPE